MTYDLTARAMFASHPKPYATLEANIVPLGHNTYALRFYQPNFVEFSGHQQLVIAEWAKQVLTDMNKLDLKLVWDIVNEQPPAE